MQINQYMICNLHHQLNMKIIIKNQSQVKLYSGKLTIEQLNTFINASFEKLLAPTLHYVDQDGDKITITNQEDLETLKDLFVQASYIKLILSEGATQDVQSTSTSINKNQETQPQKKEEFKHQKSLEKKEERFSHSRKKHCSWKREESEKRHHHHKKHHHHHQNKNFDQIQKRIQEKIVEIVDERIKAVLPCMKNQMNQDFEVIKQVGSLIHTGIKCIGCGIKQIVGIRYNCIICPNFDLCQKCEEKIDHQHNLLKMKRSEKQMTQQKKKSKGLLGIGKKLIKELVNPSSDSSSKSKSKSPREHHWKKHCHRRQKNNEGRIERRLEKLSRVFGQKPNMKEFIQNTLEMRCDEIIQLYAQENGIDRNQFANKRNEWKKTKLAAFYSKPQSEFQEIVKQNPNCNFREIIKILKQQGYGNYNGDNFHRMRETLRNSKKGDKMGERFQQKPESEKCEQKGNGEDYREKGKILMELKDLFGEKRSKSMYKFIEANFKLGKESIIEKWINECENKSK